MYDFYFGTKKEIKDNEKGYLIFIKRLLPRWANSIPDSEYLSIFELCDEHCKNINHTPVLVETGSGASTIILAYLAMKYDGKSYSWDTSGEKLSFLRGVISETICNYFHKNINDYWNGIGYESNSDDIGLEVLDELESYVDISFHDSSHTWLTLEQELLTTNSLYVDNSIVIIDDGDYRYLYKNCDYINLLRMKLGLKSIESPLDNMCDEFHVMTENLLKKYWNGVERIDVKCDIHNNSDIFFKYYNYDIVYDTDKRLSSKTTQPHKFNVWRISDRK